MLELVLGVGDTLINLNRIKLNEDAKVASGLNIDSSKNSLEVSWNQFLD